MGQMRSLPCAGTHATTAGSWEQHKQLYGSFFVQTHSPYTLDYSLLDSPT